MLVWHCDGYAIGPAGGVFTNEPRTPVRPTLFRAHLEALVRAEPLGKVSEEDRGVRATWPTPAGDESEL
jgi:hypothetical protein